MLKVWGRPSAYNVQKVIWFLEELGMHYEHINIGGSPGELDSKEFLAMNPNGRIPVIEDNDLLVWESNTIIRYLAATYGAGEYWVEDAAERTLAERWMDWELASLQPDFISLFWSCFRTPDDKKDGEKIDYFSRRCERNINILESHLQANRFVSGKEFSIGDICVGTSFFRYFNMGLEVSKPPHISRWYQSLSDRPAYQKIIMTPFDTLRGRLEF